MFLAAQASHIYLPRAPVCAPFFSPLFDLSLSRSGLHFGPFRGSIFGSPAGSAGPESDPIRIESDSIRIGIGSDSRFPPLGTPEAIKPPKGKGNRLSSHPRVRVTGLNRLSTRMKTCHLQPHHRTIATHSDTNATYEQKACPPARRNARSD